MKEKFFETSSLQNHKENNIMRLQEWIRHTNNDPNLESQPYKNQFCKSL